MGDKKTKGTSIRLSILIGAVIVLMMLSVNIAYAERIVENSEANKDTNQASVDTSAISTIDITSGTTPTTLVNNLLGGGITVSNVQFTGADVAAGTFSGGTGIIGFDSGIILSSGDIKNVIGPNTKDTITANNAMPGDSDLDSLISDGPTTLDAAVLEFDFVPVTNQLKFKYVFSSDEYNEFIGQYNDVFGFFVNGENVALIPNTTTPVSINNVNCGNPFNCALGTNPSYYRNNDLQDGGGTINTEMDGLTTVLTATANVNAGQTNHIKLAIADAVDRLYDSNVFIEAGSFASSDLKLEPASATNNIGTSHTLTARLVDGNGAPISGQSITFNVTAGPHIGTHGASATNNTGIAKWNYTGTKVGTDTIVATGSGQASNSVQKIWEQASLPTLNLTPSTATCDVGISHKLTAKLLDGSGNPISSKFVTFNITSGPHAGVSGNGTTSSTGVVTWSYIGKVEGMDNIQASTTVNGIEILSNTVEKEWTVPVGDILAYYRGLSQNPNVVETADLLKAANDWRDNINPPGFSVSLTNIQLMTLADEWRSS